MAEYIQKVIGRAKDGKPIIAVIPKNASTHNSESYRNEKRMKELARRGYKPPDIAAMMNSPKYEFKNKEVEKAIKNPHIKLDGSL